MPRPKAVKAKAKRQSSPVKKDEKQHKRKKSMKRHLAFKVRYAQRNSHKKRAIQTASGERCIRSVLSQLGPIRITKSAASKVLNQVCSEMQEVFDMATEARRFNGRKTLMLQDFIQGFRQWSRFQRTDIIRELESDFPSEAAKWKQMMSAHDVRLVE